MQFFSIDRIKQCSLHLENFHSGWVIVPFVLAANGVNKSSFVDLHKKNGSDELLDKFFGGSLIGLTAGKGGNALRPRFKEIVSTFVREGKGNDLIINQATKLWANAYSSRGYREMAGRGELEIRGTEFRLTDRFQPAFESKLPSTFHFEEFLVWLYAFKGIPDEITNWAQLFSHLLAELAVPSFAPEFSNRFKIDNPPKVPWPTDFLNARPSDAEFQKALMPSVNAPTVVPDSPALGDDDAILSRVMDAIDDGERNFLLYGPPGTGKTMYAHALAARIAGDIKRITKLQFHPSLSYDDFIEGYAPDPKARGILYKPTSRHFMRLCETAQKTQDEYFVIVIDELSRGDPSRVFGDVLTYIDKDYRGEKFQLSYSERIVFIPDNVIIIATTNPYDRSVTELDDALLRRFHMIEFQPDAKALEKHFVKSGLVGDYSNRVVRLFSELNRLLPFGFGHAFFFRLEGPEQLSDEWNSKLRFLVKRALQFDVDRLSEIDAIFDELFPKQMADPKGRRKRRHPRQPQRQQQRQHLWRQ